MFGNWLGQWSGQWWGGEPTGPVNAVAATLDGASAVFVGTVVNPAQPETAGGGGSGSDAIPLRGGSILSDADYRRTAAAVVNDALGRLVQPDRIDETGRLVMAAGSRLASEDVSADIDDDIAIIAALLAMDDD